MFEHDALLKSAYLSSDELYWSGRAEHLFTRLYKIGRIMLCLIGMFFIIMTHSQIEFHITRRVFTSTVLTGLRG